MVHLQDGVTPKHLGHVRRMTVERTKGELKVAIYWPVRDHLGERPGYETGPNRSERNQWVMT